MRIFIIGDIIHLIGYYPMTRPTTSTTYRPTNQFDSSANNKPYYHYPQNDHQQNEWNTYESNHIPHGTGSYSTFNSPISSSSSSSSFHNKPQNNYNYNNNYGNGFLDETGYQITPSPVTNNINNFNNRPKPLPSRPTSINNFDEYDDGYNYGSYQGIDREQKQNKISHKHLIMHQKKKKSNQIKAQANLPQAHCWCSKENQFKSYSLHF